MRPIRAAPRHAPRRTPPPTNTTTNRLLSASRRFARIVENSSERHVQERTRARRADLFPCFQTRPSTSLSEGHGKRPLFRFVSFQPSGSRRKERER
jgi:hypothetical protein